MGRATRRSALAGPAAVAAALIAGLPARPGRGRPVRDAQGQVDYLTLTAACAGEGDSAGDGDGDGAHGRL